MLLLLTLLLLLACIRFLARPYSRRRYGFLVLIFILLRLILILSVLYFYTSFADDNLTQLPNVFLLDALSDKEIKLNCVNTFSCRRKIDLNILDVKARTEMKSCTSNSTAQQLVCIYFLFFYCFHLQMSSNLSQMESVRERAS